ncbi:OmpP1/FadL family transporter [Flavobacterium soli]|uniref:OmpP1/FadL family transporter n=1 Tax=Flavobacterium soli TaxID=344881 RepID=UPI000400E408|nr:membrane protein [Flavobacterium soli]
MIKKVIVGICLLFAIGTFAQEGTASPYSFYGIGDIRFKGTAENRFMGGLSIFPDSTHINLQNPAGYAGLKRTTLTLGGTYATTNLQTNTGQGKPRRTTIDYLAIGLPISSKVGVGFGLMPYSSVGYKLQSSSTDDATSIMKTNQASGTGGVNRAFLGIGYQVTPNLSLGANLDYNFGEIETTSYEFWSVIENGTRELNTSKIRGVSFNTGAMWNKRIYKKLDMFASAIYTPESKLNFTNERSIAIISQTNGTIVDPGEIDASKTDLKLPSKIALGVGIGEVRKWLVGAEYTFQNTSNFGNRFNDITNATFENSSKISFGGYYIPNYNSFTSYMERMTYRAGFRHENTGLVINEKSINDTAVTFGLGFPISGSFSNINFGLEYGKKGTKAQNLVEENYLNFSLSLSLNDKWFVKRKYD